MKTMRLLPVLLSVAALAFTLRVGEVVTGFRDLSGGAQAEEKKIAEKKETDKKTESKPEEKEAPVADEGGGGTKNWPDPAEMDPDLAEVRADLFKDLAARRIQLDMREKNLATREAVLKAAESEIDQKYRELSELRKQLQGLLSEQSEAEAERFKSLVRIYEGMKPAEAARIFNTLDLSILLDVLTRMSERKSAPILAAMDADRARTVTLMMAQQRSLPDLPELISPQAGGDAGPQSE